MSRVEQALQRAAAEGCDPMAGVSTLPTSAGQSAGTQPLQVFAPEVTAPAALRAVATTAPPPAAIAFPTTVASSERTDTPETDLTAADGGQVKLLERVTESLVEKMVVDRKMNPASREQYRRLAATLHDRQLRTGCKVIMVTSAVPGEGKTLTSSNLALTFSESYRRHVLLIDADLRRPSIHSVFGLGHVQGLSEGLQTEEPQKLGVRQLSRRLAVLPAGQPTSDPMAKLTSERMRDLILEARDAFDWVIIDTPPLALLPDAHLLVTLVDGALLVVKASVTPYTLVKRAADAIGKEHMVGVVLNRATTSSRATGYGYYDEDYYYGHGDETPAES